MKKRYLILSLLHHRCLTEMTEMRKLKVSCHALFPPESHTASAEVGSAHIIFLFLQVWKQL